MGFYLLDNPPKSRQFYPSRVNGMTGGVVIHTTEGVGGNDSAENTAGFIARRSDPGSYHCIVDYNSAVMLMPDNYTAFAVAADGYNSRTWNIALACRREDLRADDFLTNVLIERAAEQIVAFWRRNNIDPLAVNDWIGPDVLKRAGLCQHGEAQPWDRSDAWVGVPDQFALGIIMQDAIRRQAGGYAPAPPPPPPVPLPPAPIPPDLSWIVDAINNAKGQVLRLGSRGDAVRWLQVLLNAKSQAGLKEDGVFGASTDAAVRKFQAGVRDFFRIPRFAVDGVVGPATWFWLTL